MAKPNGRPQANVFTAYRRKTGEAKCPGAPLLKAHRALYIGMHKSWGNNPQLRFRLKSFRYREEGKPDWELYRAAEMAMLVMGRKYPEKVFKRYRADSNGEYTQAKELDKYLPLDHEAMSFLRWCRNEVTHSIRIKRGKKPDPEAIFKTALSALVAKKLRQPKGGNSRVLPSAREISQVWYVLFGETESHEAIRARLKRTGQFCDRYDKDMAHRGSLITSSGKKPRYIGPLGRAILSRVK